MIQRRSIPGLLGVACGAGFAVRWLLLGEADDRALLLALCGGVLLLTWAWLDRAATQAHTSTREGRAASRMVGAAALVVAVGAGLYVGARAVGGAVDLTSPGRFTLSDQARQLAASLPQDVELIAFLRHGSEAQRAFVPLAEALEAAGPVKVTWADPRTDPLLAATWQVDADAEVVIARAGDRHERLGLRLDEVHVAQTLRRLTTAEEHVACWLQGHGEARLDGDESPDSLSAAVTALEGGPWKVRLAEGLADPLTGCDVLVIVRPTDTPTAEEEGRLTAFHLAGGRSLWLIEPHTPAAWADLVHRFGLRPDDGVLLDGDPSRRLFGVDDPSVLLLPRDAWPPGALGASLGGAAVFTVARAVDPIDGAAGVAVHGLAFSSSRAVTIAVGERPEAIPPGTEGRERALVAASEITDPAALGAPSGRPGGRLLVIGDSSFATNRHLDVGANQELFLHALSWLVDDEDALGARPPPAPTLVIPAGEQAAMIFVAVLLLPGLALAVAARLGIMART